ncbi:hypothetical protein BDV96DRAFT_254615 [Lophiotrema nucula]|uniref:Uncharacterized protein n=1 Tax=Lophiotrema nucula TaxID=690887 RepID=A0A6A5YQ76_9PLEO|nr:hypothetical protein BDV96DRAFT_254615 [Lophiotrema nucula]
MPAVYLFKSAAVSTNPPLIPRQFPGGSTSPPMIPRKAIAIIACLLVLVVIVAVFASFFLCCYGRRSCLCYRYREEPKRLNTGSSDNTSTESIPLQDLMPVPRPPRNVLKKLRKSLPSRKSTIKRGDYSQNAQARHYRTSAALETLGIERRATVETQVARPKRDSLELARGWPLLEDVPLDGR